MVISKFLLAFIIYMIGVVVIGGFMIATWQDVKKDKLTTTAIISTFTPVLNTILVCALVYWIALKLFKSVFGKEKTKTKDDNIVHTSTDIST